LSEATAENLELQRLIMNQDVRKHETDTKLRIMEVRLLLCFSSSLFESKPSIMQLHSPPTDQLRNG
jgi:hypothetical protein